MGGIGAIVRSRRELAGLTQADLADKAGVKQSYLSRLEAGKRDSRPSAVVLGRIARALGVSVDELLLEAGARPSKNPTEELRLKRLERAFVSLPADRQVELLAIAETLAKLPGATLAPRIIGADQGRQEEPQQHGP
jgi:transcriptional regulator with XRE-family HTH domain